jgi:hypothetical protein
VRRAVGDDYTIMLDSTWAYQYPEALRVGKVAEALGFYWYEDPLADDDLYNYVKLKQQLSIPILATEYAPGGFTALAPWITYQATDYLRGDVAVKGGITPLVKSAHLAEGFHMNFEIHHGGNSLNNVANIHVIMAIRNCEFFEVLLPAGAQKYGLTQDIEVDAHGSRARALGPGPRRRHRLRSHPASDHHGLELDSVSTERNDMHRFVIAALALFVAAAPAAAPGAEDRPGQGALRHRALAERAAGALRADPGRGRAGEGGAGRRHRRESRSSSRAST